MYVGELHGDCQVFSTLYIGSLLVAARCSPHFMLGIAWWLLNILDNLQFGITQRLLGNSHFLFVQKKIVVLKIGRLIKDLIKSKKKFNPFKLTNVATIMCWPPIIIKMMILYFFPIFQLANWTLQIGFYEYSRITKIDIFVSYLLYWTIFFISSTWMSKNNQYTMFRGDHLNLCMLTYTFGIGVCPNEKQISYSFPMVFATK